MLYNTESTIALISHIHSVTADFLQTKLSEKGLPNLVSSHGFILYLLSAEQSLSMGEISKRINRDKSTTTVLVRKLKETGFVHETISKTDNRIKFIELTETGKKYTAITSQLSRELLDKCFSGFSPQEKKMLSDLLNKLSDNFEN